MYEITESDVRDGFSTSASSADITAYIAVIDEADTCLTSKNITEAKGKQMKILAVRHFVTLANDKGQVKQERAISGASRSFVTRKNPDETAHSAALRALDATNCVLRLLNGNRRVQLRAVGRYSTDL